MRKDYRSIVLVVSDNRASCLTNPQFAYIDIDYPTTKINKKVQLLLTNPLDAKACQKLL